MSDRMTDMSGLYSNFKVNPSRKSGTLTLDKRYGLRVDEDEKVEDWMIFDAESGDFVTQNEVSQHTALIQSFQEDWNKMSGGAGKDPIDNLKESGFKFTDTPDEISEKVKESSNWSEGGFNKMKPEPQHIQDAVFEEVEPANLPAPIGIHGIVRPAVSAAEALAAWKEFQALKNCIIEKSDIQTIQGKPFIKKSGWRKFATFYNLTDKIVEETQIPIEKGGFYWKIKVVCTAPNGRQTEGVGMCSSLEKSGARQLHDVYTTAHTRSKNRAISDMIAAGEVSAEEMA